jgi:hypothetical protein
VLSECAWKSIVKSAARSVSAFDVHKGPLSWSVSL